MQLPEVPVRVSAAGKKRKLSENVEAIDLTGLDIEGKDEPVSGSICNSHGQLLTSILKERVSIAELVECNQVKKGKGRNAMDETQRLSIAYMHTKTRKLYWGCIAPECNHLRAGNRQLSRILVHAMGCPYLPPELKNLANDTAVNQHAPGIKVNPKQIRTDTENQGAPHKKPKTIQGTITDIAVTTGKIKYQDEVDLAIVQLFAANGIPANVLDSPQWKKFVEVVSHSKGNSPSSTTLTKKLIPAEAALVRKYQTEFLQTCANLTLTFDGGSTRKPSSVYTIHITTAERETFFMEGYDATDERHTAEYLGKLITKASYKNYHYITRGVQ